MNAKQNKGKTKRLMPNKIQEKQKDLCQTNGLTSSSSVHLQILLHLVLHEAQLESSQ